MRHDIIDDPKQKAEDARDLQARLYREIGISAVAAALRFTVQPEPAARKAEKDNVPTYLKQGDLAA